MQDFQRIINLIGREPLYLWLKTSLDSVAKKASDNSLVRHDIKHRPDMDVLLSLLSRPILDNCLAQGATGQMLVSFALRHQATLVNNDLCGVVLGQEPAGYLAPLQGADTIPVVGYSPRGLFVFQRRRGYCRAFDDVDIPLCGQKTSGVYCSEHQTEAIDASEAAGSRQAQMRRFYLNPENLKAYTDKDLKSLVREFWERLEIAKKHLDQVSYDEALSSFSLSASEVANMSSSELQKAYYRLCHVHHPDMGGDAAAFHRIRASYQVLKG